MVRHRNPFIGINNAIIDTAVQMLAITPIIVIEAIYKFLFFKLNVKQELFPFFPYPKSGAWL